MKAITIQNSRSVKKSLIYAFFLFCSLTLISYKSSATGVPSFTVTVGPNGHYTFTSTSTGYTGWPSYSWNPGDGSGWQYGGATFIHTYTVNTTYTATLWVDDTSGSGGSDSVSMPITVTNVTTPCNLSAAISVSYGVGGSVTFTSTSTGTNANTLYYWSPGDSNQRYQEASTYTHTYLWNGNYLAWLTISDTGNAYCIDSTAVWVRVLNADSSACHYHANFTATLDTNGQVTFTSTSTGIGSNAWYTWNMGNGSGSSSGNNETTLVYTFASNGTYSVTLYINSDSSFCHDSITIPITVTNACNMNVSFTYQYDSTGQVKFTSTSTGIDAGAQYNWTFGDGSSANGYDTATHEYPFIGNYNATLTIVNPGGCTVSSSQSIYIYNQDSLQASFTYYDTSGTYLFTSTSLGTNANTYYRWTPGDGTPADSGLGMTTYQHTYTSGGPVSANLTIWYTVLPQGALTHAATGRYDESSYTTVIHVALGLQSVTNTKTYNIYPNPNDGSFKIAVDGLSNEKNAEIRISNMMGQIIYQSTTSVYGGTTLSNINLPNAASGIYLLQVITSDNTYTSRIAIQK